MTKENKELREIGKLVDDIREIAGKEESRHKKAMDKTDSILKSLEGISASLKELNKSVKQIAERQDKN